MDVIRYSIQVLLNVSKVMLIFYFAGLWAVGYFIAVIIYPQNFWMNLNQIEQFWRAKINLSFNYVIS